MSVSVEPLQEGECDLFSLSFVPANCGGPKSKDHAMAAAGAPGEDPNKQWDAKHHWDWDEASWDEWLHTSKWGYTHWQLQPPSWDNSRERRLRCRAEQQDQMVDRIASVLKKGVGGWARVHKWLEEQELPQESQEVHFDQRPVAATQQPGFLQQPFMQTQLLQPQHQFWQPQPQHFWQPQPQHFQNPGLQTQLLQPQHQFWQPEPQHFQSSGLQQAQFFQSTASLPMQVGCQHAWGPQAHWQQQPCQPAMQPKAPVMVQPPVISQASEKEVRERLMQYQQQLLSQGPKAKPESHETEETVPPWKEKEKCVCPCLWENLQVS